MKEKAKRFYPKRVYKEEAEIRAIVCLRDCGGLSFLSILRLLKYKENSKRNVEYSYKANKDKYKCSQCENLKNKINGVI